MIFFLGGGEGGLLYAQSTAFPSNTLTYFHLDGR